jgi:predicted acetyltransferase
VKAVDIELTPCTDENLDRFTELETVCFPTSYRWLDCTKECARNNPRCPVDRYFLARVGDDIVGGFRILPLDMRVSTREGAAWIQVGGLGRLAVYPHYRRLGYADGVMRLVLHRSYEQGDVMSLLYPTSFSTYRRYGYGIAARHVLYSAPPRAFPDNPGREKIRPATPDDWKEINECYENQLFVSLGICRRSERVWREYYLQQGPQDDLANWIFVDSSDKATGYISSRLLPTAKYYEQRIMVSEWFAQTPEALWALLGFFRAQSANTELVKLPAPLGSSLESALVEPVWAGDEDLTPWHQPIGKLCSTLMGRLIRLEDALNAREYAQDGRINLLVEDWVLPVNSGYYGLTTEGGQGAIGTPVESDHDIRLDISVLSTLYCGGITAERARIFGLIECSSEAATQFDRMFGSFNFMVWDYF